MAQTSLLFILVFATGLLAALFIRPIYGIYTYVAVFYLDPPSRWWSAMLPDLRWSLVAAAITLIAVLIHRQSLSPSRPWANSSILVMFAIYTFWMWVQLPWVISETHLDGVILFSKYLFLMLLMYTILDNEHDFRGFCIAHVFGCAYLGWLVYLAPSGGRLEGVGGPGIDDANTLGMHLGTGLMFASFLMLAVKGKWRWIMRASIPLILNGIIQTQTRGAVVGLVLGGILTIYLKPKSIRRRYYTLGALALFGLVVVANEAFLARMESLRAAVDEEQTWDNSAASRVAIVQSQLSMFADYPFGAGHQGTMHLSRDYIDPIWWASNSGDRASHNTVMSVLVDQGIPGIVLLLFLGVTMIRMLRRMKRMDSDGLPDSLALYRTMLGGAIFTVIGSGMFAQHLKAEVFIWLLVLLAILWNLSLGAVSGDPRQNGKLGSTLRS